MVALAVVTSTTTASILRKAPQYILRTTLSHSKPRITSTPRNTSFIPSNPLHISSIISNPPPQTTSLFRTTHTHTTIQTFGLKNWQMDKGYTRIGDGPGDGPGGPGGNGGSGGGSGDEGAGGNGEGNSERNFFSWYMDLLVKFPVMTKAVTSALLTLVGDLVCQLAVDKVSSVDFKRTFIFTFLGLALVGPTLHFWYLYLSKLITTTGASGAFLRLLLDQFVFAPAFIGLFLSTLTTLEGRPSQVVPKLQQEWFSSVLANWQLWIPFQFLNFRFVPQQFQVLASNFVALVWNVILSFKAHKEIVEK